MATITTTATSSVCSSPIPTISPSLRTHHQCQQPSNPSSLSSLKLSLSFVSGDSVAVEGAPDMEMLERAARRSVKESEKWVFHGDGIEKRRRKRRRRRRGFEGLYSEEEEEEIGGEETKVDDDRASIGPSRSGFLSREEEAELCLRLKEGAKLETYGTRAEDAQGNEVASVRLSGGRGKKIRLDEILHRRREAREKLTRCYKRLVVSIASAYQDRGLNLQDLIQEGSIGLLRGAEKFDPERGYKLSTYVYWWIKQAILKAIAHNSRLVRLPGSMWELMAKVTEASNVLSGSLRRAPTCEEIANHLNLHISSVRLALDRTRSPASLDRQASDRGRMTLQEIVQGPDETTPEYMLKRRLVKKGIKKLLETLTERESRVLRLYFGLNGETPMSFEEIGKKLKLSRERVRQINGIALAKLRNEHNVNDLKMYL
ncbi:PREDICTED: RNA polymerase sigma factor sigD, chloroplastic isoform X2 [Tarenaya hassleriana]|uniref:RNA polymerase sigma factor sigD, chloroplastic isoform X2 n=1 Tax=Tarenaya hassleriana TaxID=28532 RepID=UPI00053C874B|nr:PREDICTED: RNA polymerase sigma factor sigD, chloroplastic isoform X2 [Tarenaya hassleriana]